MTTRVGVTGHRRLDNQGAWTWVESAMGKALDALEPPLVAISSLAIGADQLLASLVLGRGGELHAVIPFQGYERTFGPEDVAAYRRILAKARTVEYLTTEGTDEDKYLAAGKRIAEMAEVIIAVWDGKPARGKGGTADIVHYASHIGIRLIQINPMNHRINEIGGPKGTLSP
jgi:hypothetical protein